VPTPHSSSSVTSQGLSGVQWQRGHLVTAYVPHVHVANATMGLMCVALTGAKRSPRATGRSASVLATFGVHGCLFAGAFFDTDTAHFRAAPAACDLHEQGVLLGAELCEPLFRAPDVELDRMQRPHLTRRSGGGPRGPRRVRMNRYSAPFVVPRGTFPSYSTFTTAGRLGPSGCHT